MDLACRNEGASLRTRRGQWICRAWMNAGRVPTGTLDDCRCRAAIARPVRASSVAGKCNGRARLDPGRQPLRLEPDICNLPRNPAEVNQRCRNAACRRNCPKRRVRRYITRYGQWHVRLRSGGEVKAMDPAVNRSTVKLHKIPVRKLRVSALKAGFDLGGGAQAGLQGAVHVPGHAVRDSRD